MFKKIALAAGLLSVAAASQAAIDVTAITAKLTEGELAIAGVGAAVLVLLAIVAVYKFIRRAF